MVVTTNRVGRGKTIYVCIFLCRSCTKLEHLCLSSCPIVNNYDDIVLEIGEHLRYVHIFMYVSQELNWGA